ncbi:MAG: DUF1846 domain-containing protein [Thermoanaerobaculales bacterium]|jgi:uncharacterized protein (UPF0371 family)|nr:DUF1846 domain-containing protein [Thermoanaerobaculales bacterium]
MLAGFSGAVAFDNERYLAEQSEAILERMRQVGGKLHLEFGGKLLYDYHASRVLPGFDPNVKMRLLQQLAGHTEIILCVYAGDIDRRKVRADFGITYDADTFKLIDDLRERGLEVRGVVITRYDDQPAAETFANKLDRRGISVTTHRAIPGYPADVARVVSDDGFGANPYIETEAPLVVVNAPGPNSGKMATCLSQVYHEHRRGVRAGYAKFETFPIWNLPLRHPVNAAYEAATAELRDVNLIDPFHLEAYDERAVNYNRDVEAFPLLKRILEKITGESMYASPTDMGVNRAGFAVIDDEAARDAGKCEIIRRYFRYACDEVLGLESGDPVRRIEGLMEEFDLKPEHRSVVVPARQVADAAEAKAVNGHRGVYSGAAVELDNHEIATGHNSPLMHASSALVLNAIKVLAGIPKHLDLISPVVIESIGNLRTDLLGQQSISLNLEETLIALSISSTTNPTAQQAMQQLPRLSGCELHLTHLPTPGDERGLRRLGVNLTCDPQFATTKLFMS